MLILSQNMQMLNENVRIFIKNTRI